MDPESLTLIIIGVIWVGGLVAGMFSLYLGYRLLMKGIGGEAGLDVQHNKSKLKLVKAAPGIFFALFGVAILLLAISKGIEVVADNGRRVHFYEVH